MGQRAADQQTGCCQATISLEAKAWAARRPKGAPEPTALHLEFIRASEEEAEARLSEQRKQLEAVAAAQAARETALHDREEALKQAADAQRKRARIRNIALVAVSILACSQRCLAVGGLAASDRSVFADEQQAERKTETQADDILGRALNIIAKLQSHMDIDSKNEAVALFQRGADHGDASSMRNLGVSYNNGLGVTQDYAKAREWYEKAAAKGVRERHGRPRRAFTSTVRAWRRTTPRRASGTRRPPPRATRAP